MSELLSFLLSFPPERPDLAPKEYEAQAMKYVKELGKVPPAIWTKPIGKQNILELLDPAVNSIPYATALSKQLDAGIENTEQVESLVPRCHVFFTTFDPIQVRYAGDVWRGLFETVCGITRRSNSTEVQPLVAAILRLDPAASTFTSLHLSVLRLCMKAQVPSQALPILDKDVYSLPQDPARSAPEDILSDEYESSNVYLTPRSGLAPKPSLEHVLEYYLLGAQVYIGLRRFGRARLFLEYILLSPTSQHATSAFQVEAYRKWVLVGLIADGKCFPVPRTLDPAVLKTIRSIAKAYDTLAEDFERREWRKYNADVETGDSTWHEDGNLGLVQECAKALLRFRVLDLQKTYAALPLSRVAQHLELEIDDTNELLVEMMSSGFLDASIMSEKSENILRFRASEISASTAQRYGNANSTTSDHELEAQAERIETLVSALRDADRRLQLTKEFVEHTRRVKRAAGPDADPADAMDLSWDAPISRGVVEDGDEDIMAT